MATTIENVFEEVERLENGVEESRLEPIEGLPGSYMATNRLHNTEQREKLRKVISKHLDASLDAEMKKRYG